MAEVLEELLGRCRRGDRQAVETILGRFSRHSIDLARTVLEDDHLAEDAVQEAFMTALSRLSQLREPRSFPAWLRQIVRSEAHRILRRRREERLEDAHESPAPEAPPDERAQAEEMRRLVRRALARLPQTGRETAELFYLEQLSHIEVAVRLAVPEGTVRRRLHDAREQMRSMLLGYIADRKPAKKPEAPPEGRLPF